MMEIGIGPLNGTSHVRMVLCYRRLGRCRSLVNSKGTLLQRRHRHRQRRRIICIQ